MTLAESGTLESGAKYQYLSTLVRGEALRQFDLFSADVEGTKILNVDYIIKGFSHYFSPVNFLSKQKRTMSRVMKTAQSNCKTLCGAFD